MKKFIFISVFTIALSNSMHCSAATAAHVMPVKFFYDGNANCVKDGTEPFAMVPILVRVDSNGVPVDTISATSGFTYFSNCVTAGTIFKFSILPSAGNPTVICPSSGFITDTLVISSSTTIYPDKYFGIACPTTSAFDLAEHAIVYGTGVRDQWGYIYAGNNSCGPVTGTLTFNFSPKYIYAGGSDVSPTPASASGNTLTWNLSTLMADEDFDHIFYMIRYNPTTGMLTLGDTVQGHVTVTPISGDSNPTNNSETIIETVTAGHDPNDISVSPAGCIASAITPVTLRYTIRFENTGTDTADNIYIKDTLSEFLDLNTLRIEMATHPMFIDARAVEDTYTGDIHHVVKFDSPNIKLLDSSHHGECDGAVVYTIKTRPGLSAGTHIYNYAGIYFDYNDAVMTNTTDNVVGCPTKIREVNNNSKIYLYPNPATNQLTIKTEQDAYTSFTITNSMGQVLAQQAINAAQTNVDIKSLAPGLYYVTMKGESGIKTMKFVKMD